MRDAYKGTYNDAYTFCPVNAYGDCPYCDQCSVCHIDDPMTDCDDWGSFWESWDDWLIADMVDPDAPESFAEDVYGYEDTMEDNEE